MGKLSNDNGNETMVSRVVRQSTIREFDLTFDYEDCKKMRIEMSGVMCGKEFVLSIFWGAK